MEKNMLGSLQEYQEARFTKRVAFQKGESVVFVLNFMPGQQLPAHQHPGTHVFILALEGTGTVTADGTAYELRKGDIIHLEGDETFAYVNDGQENASLYVILTKTPGPEYAQNI
ncbi:cupin domain-containing protein [Paenibacillus antibioticophila]|uniref:cupin domain-containing protein n=1 Tax=Paenibacillus antibioticophila TaxID=1274374 RepID=UPI0005C89AAB|nr:cupin domain-containing protein [Paenibacillus antibioticophila]